MSSQELPQEAHKAQDCQSESVLPFVHPEPYVAISPFQIFRDNAHEDQALPRFSAGYLLK